jgi:propanol-preferring alcohol dehydrogenase
MVCSLQDSGLGPGDWAAFPGGAGGVGIQGVQLAKAMGMRPIVIDTGADKKKLSLEMGAEAFVDFRETDDVAKEVMRIADGIGAHGVFCTAVPAYKDAVSLIGDRIGGVVSCIGLPPKESGIILGASPNQFVMKNLSIKG